MYSVKLFFAISFLLPYQNNLCVSTYRFNSLLPDYDVETYTITTRDLYNLVLFKVNPNVPQDPHLPPKGIGYKFY